MIEKIHETRCGGIHYYINEFRNNRKTLVFLPGLSADHRLFDSQIEHFGKRYNMLVWDAPMHASSRPFTPDFDLMDKAGWLDEILTAEGIRSPVLIGQSMGGYVGQAYLERFPGKLKGFVAIDSAPLQRSYMTWIELRMMDKVEAVYRRYPWQALCQAGPKGTAATEQGRNLMLEMMKVYDGDPVEYSRLVGHGYRMLAKAIRANLQYRIDCPAMLICGEEDKAGSTKKYNIRWSRKTGLPITWIPGAGHNSNTDKPKEVNRAIEVFVNGLRGI